MRQRLTPFSLTNCSVNWTTSNVMSSRRLESTHTADLTTCPTSVPGCQDRALPVQRPDSPSASANCLSGMLPTFPSNYLTLPPQSLLSAGDTCFVSWNDSSARREGGCRCAVSVFGRGCTFDILHFSESTSDIQTSDFVILPRRDDHPTTHPHTERLRQPSGRGNSSSKAICCPPRCYGNWMNVFHGHLCREVLSVAVWAKN